MPAKTDKPKIKVEEIKEDTLEEESNEESSPKISSFSQLDTMKASEKTSSDEKPAVETEEVKEEQIEEKPQTDPTPPMDAPAETKPQSEEKMSSEDVKEWLKDIRPDTTKDVEKGGGFNFKLFFVFVIIFALLGALVGGIFYYKQNVTMQSSTDNTDNISQVTPTAAEVVTPTPEASLDLTKYSVNVLNGSGIKGEAGKVKGLLTNGGFSTDKVDTGNANSYDYKKTSVSMKKDVPEEVFDKVKAALGSGYDVEKAVATLSESSKYDIELTVGNSN